MIKVLNRECSVFEFIETELDVVCVFNVLLIRDNLLYLLSLKH